jgi:hypothetical protein
MTDRRNWTLKEHCQHANRGVEAVCCALQSEWED